MASPKVNSRTADPDRVGLCPVATVSGINILVDSRWIGIRRVLGELDGGIHFSGHFALDAI
jgi:hypothetical protein